MKNTLATGLAALVLAFGGACDTEEPEDKYHPPQDPEIITEDATTPYSVTKVVVDNRTEYRVYTDGHHFLS